MMTNDKLQELRNIIQEIFKNRSKIRSSLYVRGYDIIFTECTQQSSSYEIKGRHIYDLLSAEISLHLQSNYQNMPVCADLTKFIDAYRIFNDGLSIIARLFSYLKRYFIKTHIDTCDPSVVEIKNLGLTAFHAFFLTKSSNLLVKALLNELRNPKRSRINILKKCIHAFKQSTYLSNNRHQFTTFLKEYIEVGNEDLIHNFTTVAQFCRALKKRLFITQKVFNKNVSKNLNTTFIKGIGHKKNELIDFFLLQIRSKKDCSLVYEVLEILSAQDCFERKLNCFLKGEVHALYFLCKEEALNRSFRFLFEFYMNMCCKMQDCLRYSKAFADALDKFEPKEVENFFVDKINKFILKNDTDGCKFVVNLCYFMQLNTGFGENLLCGLKKRLLFRKTSVERERVFLDLFQGNSFQGFVSRANRCLRDIENVVSVFKKENKFMLGFLPLDSLFEDSRKGLCVKPFSKILCSKETSEIHERVVKVKKGCIMFENINDKVFLGGILLLTKHFWKIKSEKNIGYSFDEAKISIEESYRNEFQIERNDEQKVLSIRSHDSTICKTLSFLSKDIQQIHNYFYGKLTNSIITNTVVFNPHLSIVIFSLDSIRIKGSVICYTILKLLEDFEGLSIAQIESNLKFKVDSEIQKLLNVGIVFIKDDKYFLKGPNCSGHDKFKNSELNNINNENIVNNSTKDENMLLSVTNTENIIHNAVCGKSDIYNDKIIASSDIKNDNSAFSDIKNENFASSDIKNDNSAFSDIKNDNIEFSDNKGNNITFQNENNENIGFSDTNSNFLLFKKSIDYNGDFIDLVDYDIQFENTEQIKENTKSDSKSEIKCKISRLLKKYKVMKLKHIIRYLNINESKISTALNDLEENEFVKKIGDNKYEYIP